MWAIIFIYFIRNKHNNIINIAPIFSNEIPSNKNFTRNNIPRINIVGRNNI